MDVTIITREQWGAEPPRHAIAIETPTPELWLHHFGSEHHGPSGMRAVQRYHQDTRNYYDIAYSFCVDDDGSIYEGRGPGIAGGHTSNHNLVSHAICLMGHFGNRAPTKAAVQSVARLVAHGAQRSWWPAQITGGHREAPRIDNPTSCPGNHAQAAIADMNALATRYLTQENDMATYTLDEARDLMRAILTLFQGNTNDAQVEEHAHALAADPTHVYRALADLARVRFERVEDRVKNLEADLANLPTDAALTPTQVIDIVRNKLG